MKFMILIYNILKINNNWKEYHFKHFLGYDKKQYFKQELPFMDILFYLILDYYIIAISVQIIINLI